MERFELSTDQNMDEMLWLAYKNYKDMKLNEDRAYFRGMLDLYMHVARLDEITVKDGLLAHYQRATRIESL